MSKSHFVDLDADDRRDYRQHFARTSNSRKQDVTFGDAVRMEIEYIEFMAYLMKKYEIDEEEDFHIDEVSGKVYYYD